VNNSWTLKSPEHHVGRGAKVGPWVEQQEAPPLTITPEHYAAASDQLGRLAALDAVVDRVAQKLRPKPWSAICSGGVGVGLAAGTTGAATVHAGRCLLQGIHNPTGASVTFSVADLGTGDSVPKYACTVASGATNIIGTEGLLFNKGVTILSMTAGGSLTFFGSSLDY
jgi:hypothetical protein